MILSALSVFLAADVGGVVLTVHFHQSEAPLSRLPPGTRVH